MVFWTKCKRCYDRKKGYCEMSCSKKGVERITPERLTMKGIAEALENNIGTYISLANISKYSREIEGLISNG